MRLAASMITYNEVSRYLPLVIDHLRGFCDQIIVLDDGSTDGTADWLREHTDDQLHVTFGKHVAHQGKSRGKLLELVVASGATHCLTIDADELIERPDDLRAVILDRQNVDVWSLEIAEVWNPLPEGLQLRVDGGWRVHPLPVVWKVPRRLGGNWRILDKARACRRFPVAVGSIRAVPAGMMHFHFGWADKSERQRRYDFYIERDGGRFHARAHLLSIAWPDSKIAAQRGFAMVPWPTGAVFDRLRVRFAPELVSENVFDVIDGPLV